MRAQPQPTRSFSTGERARVNVATNRSGSVTQSSIAPTRSTSVYRQPTTSSQRVVTRDWDGDRDWDRDRDSDRYRDRDWSDRRYRLSHDVYRNWDRNRIYSWNNNRYRWYGGSWVIYDATPTVVYAGSLPAVGSSLIASVQDELQDRGYRPGPADGVMGGRTRSAIAEFRTPLSSDAKSSINNMIESGLSVPG